MINHSQTTIVGLLLAGGFSRRFGPQNKLLQPLHNGQPIALAAAKALISALPKSVAVLRLPTTDLTEPMQALGFKVVQCQTQHQEMSDSLKLGIDLAIHAFPDLTGLVIALADMPLIQPATIQQVAQRLTPTNIVQPHYAGNPGHPVGFGCDWITALRQVEGDQGARNILRANQALIVRFDCPDAGILQDIDTPADLLDLGSGAANTGL